MNGNVIRTITIRGTSEGLDKVTADLNKLASAQENVAVVSEQSAKRVLSLEDAWKRQTLKLDEAARAQANIARETRIADAALREGVATQAQHAQRLEQINQRYSTVTTATKGFATQTGLARHELINLGRQAQDVGVSLVSGQSPLMVLAQQGSQIADVFISSGKSVGSFFSQAIGWGKSFLSSTGGMVTAVLAIGGAAIYAASQFARASTTIEEALKEQNRLLKEGKALIDAKTSAEAKADAQLRGQTEFETKRNLLDLQLKLNKATEDAIKIAERRASTPTQVPSEMGEAPTAYAALKDPGLDKMVAAFEALRVAQAAGIPGLKQYNAELGKIGMAHPELAMVVEDMIKAGEAGMELERAALKAKAMADALAGIATNAQLAAVGLGSFAQFQLNNRTAEEAKDATERQAVAVLEMARAYPGMSIEVAKQLETLKGQLAVAQQITGIGQINAQHEATINNLKQQGLSLSEATAQADMQRSIALEQVNSRIKNQILSLEQSTELTKAEGTGREASIKAEHAYTNAIRDGASETEARALETATLDNAQASLNKTVNNAAPAWENYMDRAQQAQKILRQQEEATYAVTDAMIAELAALRALTEAWKYVPLNSGRGAWQYTSGKDIWQSAGGWSQFNPAGYTFTDPTVYASSASGGNMSIDAEFAKLAAASGVAGAAGQFNLTAKPTPGTDNLGTGFTRIGGAAGQLDSSRLALVAREIELMPQQDRLAAYGALRSNLGGMEQTLEVREAMQGLTDKIEQLTRATDDNTAATSAMTDVLSPFYSSDPRRTHLGFRAFAGGGIMTQYGELPLRQYQGGGMATSPQVAVFGEGSTPEAYVPVPSGRIPVEIKQPANSNRRPINVTINVQGNADSSTVAALKSTAFQQAQAMRRVMG